MADADLTHKIAAIKELLALFRFERIVYLAVTIISLIILLASGVAIILNKYAEIAVALGLFGSAGAITVTTGRLLRMWNQAIQVLFPAVKASEE